MTAPIQVAIIGGGILGLATARELLLHRAVKSLAVFEAEPVLASHQTGRNSGVVHAGIYYPPNSLKATLCLEGLSRSFQYFQRNSIPYRKVGKLIVARHQSELPALERLFQNASTNQVPGIRLLESPEEIKAVEPLCVGVAAILSPETAIVDWAVVARSYAKDIINLGGSINTSSKVVAMSHDKNIRLQIETPSSKHEIEAEKVISCAGIQSDRVAKLLGGTSAPAILPVRGEYLRITNRSIARQIRGNIYPVPDSGSGSPFLGVHFTPTMSGDIIVGPNAVLALSRYGYSPAHISPNDVRDMITYPGFWRLASRYWRFGAREMYRSAFISAAANAAREYVPSLKVEDFARQGPDRSGIRAQAVARDGSLVDDFVFETCADGRVLYTRNAPSPGATSSLAIARVIADKCSSL